MRVSLVKGPGFEVREAFSSIGGSFEALLPGDTSKSRAVIPIAFYLS